MKNQPPGPEAGKQSNCGSKAGGCAETAPREPASRRRREWLSALALAPAALSTSAAVTALPATAAAQTSRTAAGGLPYGPVQGLEHAFEVARQMREEALARGDQGYGAVVVRDQQIVGLGASQVVSQGDPTAHAEMNAIRDAARRLGRRDLSDCILVSTSRPCRMCETAAYWARVGEMVAGSAGQPAVAPAYCDQ